MPAPSSAAAPWYSFQAGPAHIAILSTEHDLSAASPQAAWLAADLAAASSVWTIVGAHRFFYIDSSTEGRDAAAGAELLAALEPIFVANGVDLVIAGHHHSYQRTCRVVAGACDDVGPMHVVAGNAGAGLSGVSAAWPAIFRAVILEHGFLKLSANETHLLGSARRSMDGTEMDAFALAARERRSAC